MAKCKALTGSAVNGLIAALYNCTLSPMKKKYVISLISAVIQVSHLQQTTQSWLMFGNVRMSMWQTTTGRCAFPKFFDACVQ